MKEDYFDDVFDFVSERIKFERIEKDYELKKVESDVFDRRTMLVLYDLMKHGVFDIIEFPLKIGKEANVFRAKKGKRFRAVKIYRTSTMNFNAIIEYISGDPRFEHFKRSKRALISIWAQKEYRNLSDCYENGVLVPKPYAFQENVIVMEYLGNRFGPSPMLKDAKIENMEKIFNDVKNNIERMVNMAKLVHGDLSEYNIVYHKERAYFIDVSQALPVKHPKARELLERDIRNMVKFFTRKGLNVNFNDFKVDWGLLK